MSPRIQSCSLLALAVLAACSVNPKPSLERERAPAAAVETLPPVEPVAGAGDLSAAQDPVPQDEPAAEPDPAQREAQEALRQLWQQPNFQRQLAQNWLRGSEVDPPLTLREGEFRLEVLELITQDEVGKATARLQDLQGEDASPVWDYMLGKLYSAKEDFDGAAREYVKAVNKYPSFRRAWQELGFAQMRGGKFRSAAESFVEVLSLGGGDPSTYGALGIAHFQGGDFASAESAFRLTIMMDPREDRWKLALAEALGRQRKYADSINLIDGLLANDRDNVDLWKSQAYAYANIGETDKAATNIEIVDRLGGGDFVTLSNLGTIYLNDGLYTLAVDAYLRAIEREDRGSHGDVLGVATRLAQLSKYDEATRLVHGIEAAYAAELDQDAKLSMLRMRARLAAQTGASEEQVALLQQIVQDDPLDGDALLALAVHFQTEGDLEQAAFRYEQAARNAAFTAKAKRLHGQMLANDKRFADAERLLEASLQLSDSDDVRQLLEYVKSAKARAGKKKAGA
ncbi:MAG: tetratricopeptide repeat protein [Planctomycetota bacterium]